MAEVQAKYWCHGCQRNIEPRRENDSLVCSTCNGEFIEEVDENDDPADFVEGESDGEDAPPLPSGFQFNSTYNPGEGGSSFSFTFTGGPQRAPGNPHAPRPPFAFPQDAHPIFQLFNQLSQGRFGDYVIGDEALDNIITRLMDQDAARNKNPAPEEVINNLPTFKIDQTHLDEKAECPVCKDEFSLEDEVAELPPCKHFFHRDCIIPWLKVNGTCPVCRSSLVEKKEGESSAPSSSSSSSSSSAPSTPSSAPPNPSNPPPRQHQRLHDYFPFAMPFYQFQPFPPQGPQHHHHHIPPQHAHHHHHHHHHPAHPQQHIRVTGPSVSLNFGPPLQNQNQPFGGFAMPNIPGARVFVHQNAGQQGNLQGATGASYSSSSSSSSSPTPLSAPSSAPSSSGASAGTNPSSSPSSPSSDPPEPDEVDFGLD